MLHYFALITLGPLLAYQGVKVRRDTPQLPEAKGDRSGQLGSGIPLSLVILGDSAAAGVGVEDQQQALSGSLSRLLASHFTLSWQLCARSGNTTKDCIELLTERHNALPKADVVLLSLGVNDVIKLNSRATWLSQLTTLLQAIENQTQAKLILITKVPPMGLFPALPQPLRWFMGYKANWFNKGLEVELAKRHKATSDSAQYSLLEIAQVMDAKAVKGLMARDGFHPGEKIYQRWAEVSAQYVARYFNPSLD